MPNRNRTILVGLALIVAVCLAYCGVWRFEFVHYDDNSHVFANEHITGGLTPESVRWAFGQFNGAQWIPLTWISFMADVSLFGLNPGAMHVENVALHALNAVLLFLLLSRLTSRIWPAAAVAGIFALHPVNAESVAWICERKNVLSTAFWLLSTLAYVAYAQSKRLAWLACSVVCLALGLMVKAMLVTLPCTLLLLDAWPLGRHRAQSWLRLVGEKIPHFAIAITASVLQMKAAANDGLLWEGSEAPSFMYRAANAGANIVHYLQMLLVPGEYAPMLPLPLSAPIALGIAGWALAASAIVAGWRLRTRTPYVLFGTLWFLGVQVPVSGIVGAGDAVRCDRYLYVPQIGVIIAVVWGMSAMVRKMSREAVATGTGVVLLALGVLTFQTAGHWRNTTTLATHSAAVSPNSIVAQKLSGWAMAREGRLPEAYQYYTTALTLGPSNIEARCARAIVIARMGKNAEAIAEFRTILAAEPGHAEASLNLGSQLFAAGANAEARAILEGMKQTAATHYWLARVADADGRREDGRRHYETALKLATDEAWKEDAVARLLLK